MEKKRHHSSAHLKLKPYKCTECEASFVKKSYLLRHVYKYRNEEAIAATRKDDK
jgi:hypothetical protein